MERVDLVMGELIHLRLALSLAFKCTGELSVS